jgi:hypothetical protein
VSPPDDDRGVNPWRRTGGPDDAVVESLLAGRSTTAPDELSQLLDSMRSMGRGPAPLPTTALAALLTDGIAVPAQPLVAGVVRNRSRIAVAAAAAAAMLGGGLITAASANALPTRLQRLVSTTVNRVTPFTLPTPDPDRSAPTPQHDTGVPQVPSAGTDGSGVPDPTVVHPTSRTSTSGEGTRRQDGRREDPAREVTGNEGTGRGNGSPTPRGVDTSTDGEHHASATPTTTPPTPEPSETPHPEGSPTPSQTPNPSQTPTPSQTPSSSPHSDSALSAPDLAPPSD